MTRLSRKRKRRQARTHRHSEFLSPADWQNLAASGLTKRTVAENGIRTELDPGTVKALLRWDRDADKLGPCMVFPYRTLDGHENGFVRVRPASPRRERGGKLVKYEQPRGESLRAFFPVRCVHDLRGTRKPIIITEGEKKALALAQAGYAAIGLTGVDCWATNGHLIDDLRVVQWGNRHVYIAFDCDPKPSTRANVRRAAKRLAAAMTEEGARVYFVELPPAVNGGKQGVDDFLVARGNRAFRQLLQAALPACGINAVRADAVKLEKVEWLWTNRIPFAALTMLDGDPGLGKSTLTCDLAARLSRGWAMPGEPAKGRRPNGHVIVLSAEDDPGRTIRPRLQAAGANLQQVTIPTHASEVDGDRPISLPGDLPYIEKLIHQHQARLLVIDPLMGFLDSRVDANSDASVRRVLHRLGDMARRTGTAIVLLRHLNKRPGTAAIYRGGGSIAFTATARSGLVVGKDKDNENLRVLASLKNNLGPPPRSLSFSLVPAKAAGCDTSRVEWGGEVDATADDIIDCRAGQDGPTKTESCVARIISFLNERGPMGSNELNRLVVDATGASLRTVKGARELANVLARPQPGPNKKWFCRLPHQEFTWERERRDAVSKWAKNL